MKIGSVFPSTYLKAADLPDGSSVTVQIDRVEIEELGDEKKPVLYFVGKLKGLVLNKTNANTISKAYGEETDGWHGCQIQLYATEVQYGAEMVPGIRIRIPKATGASAAGNAIVDNRRKQQAAPPPELPDDSGVTDDCPF